jgi:hypothetical protein
MPRPHESAYKLTPAEKRDLIKLIEQGKPLCDLLAGVPGGRLAAEKAWPAGIITAGMGGMRFVALLVVVAIIYAVWSHRVRTGSVTEAMKEADAVAAQPVAQATTIRPAASAQPASSPSGLRAPMDRTRAVLNQVRQRNGDGDF